ncbi:hypothetical protein [Hymenobacter nivis]|uniref:hypothetical protein n=1 Tax=Hymenobacter nivis TaxID=1850093 RepID=UPI0013A586A0|nr:hypothetical protein [Hymenobacter nivis]
MGGHGHRRLAVGGAPGLRHPLLVGAAGLYGGLWLNRHWLHWPLPALVTSHLADLLALPLMLGLALAAHRWLIDPRGTLPVAWLVGAWLGVSVWFEGLLPLWSARAVADPLDVLAYAAGTLGFHYWLNRPPGPLPRA